MTTQIEKVEDRAELLERIEGYAASARRSLQRGKEPTVTIGFMKSMLRRFDELGR